MSTPVPSRRSRILLVDDEPDILTTLIEVLEAEGYEVLSAHSARDAFMVIEASPPDVILLDITMPHMDGVTALRRIRAINPEVPVIMLTGNADEKVARDTLRRGAFDYVAKPFDVAHLRRVVAAAVALRGT